MYASDTGQADGIPNSDPLGDAVQSSHEGERNITFRKSKVISYF